MESSSSAEGLASFPALVLEAVWAHLSYAARCSLRATCRSLRLRIDAELLRTVVVTSYSSADPHEPPSPQPPPCGQQPPLRLPPEVHRIINSHGAAASRPTWSSRHVGSTLPVSTATPPSTVLTGAHAAATAAAAAGGRFRSLHTLVLTSHGSAAAAAAAGSSFPAALRPFLSPPPAARLAPFAACAASLTHLVLLDPLPPPSERDVAAIGAGFPALASLQLLASPGHTGTRAVVPPLGALRACTRLRNLGLDLGRSAVLGAGCRSSLGLLTQLTGLMLGVTDSGGDEVEATAAAAAAAVGCCGCCRSTATQRYHHHHHHHCHYPHHHLHQICCAPRQEGSCCASQLEGSAAAAAATGACGDGGGCVVAAMVGGVEASLYILARANLRSLELRVITFGSYHRRLLHAVAAGAAAATAASDRAVGLQHLCVRLMPTPLHAAATSASFATGGGTPSASLSCGPLALGDTAAAPAAATGWAQPSESEHMLASLPALPGLERLEVPELLLTASSQLTCLNALTRLTELRIGGVVAAGVPAPRAAAAAAAPPPPPGGGRRSGTVVLPGLRSLVVEAESPSYGSGAVVPWWSAACPDLRHLSLTLQCGGGAPGATLGGRRYDSQATAEQLAAALAHVREVRLVMCVAGRAVSSSAARGYGIAGSALQLPKDLPVILRRSGTVRHLELYVTDPAELLSCLSEDLLAAAAPPPPPDVTAAFPALHGGGAGGAGRTAAGGERIAGGLETLRLVSSLGWEAAVSAAAAAAAADGATALCTLLATMLSKALPAPGCLCLSVPGLWGAAGEGGAAAGRRWGGGGGAPEPRPRWGGGGAPEPRPRPHAVEGLARAAAARGTRLCLCGASSEERAALLQALERAGVEVAEGRCRGCDLEGPVHCVVC
ncbi:hypothetical protein PLESTB_001497100 [Pleodorina starrii]|uniref:F-box domain-containing protein n=1 Tax=Pleodorina starrii TaxID=330485 RepID=A0A9W6BWH3_9CHLO|nr:hypothetical protein PLESTB_001497100 [Pleodorina starrii]